MLWITIWGNTLNLTLSLWHVKTLTCKDFIWGYFLASSVDSTEASWTTRTESSPRFHQENLFYFRSFIDCWLTLSSLDKKYPFCKGKSGCHFSHPKLPSALESVILESVFLPIFSFGKSAIAKKKFIGYWKKTRRLILQNQQAGCLYKLSKISFFLIIPILW